MPLLLRAVAFLPHSLLCISGAGDADGCSLMALSSPGWIVPALLATPTVLCSKAEPRSEAILVGTSIAAGPARSHSALSAVIGLLSLCPTQAAQGLSPHPQMRQTPTMLVLPYEKFPVASGRKSTPFCPHRGERSLCQMHCMPPTPRPEPVQPPASPMEGTCRFSELRDTGA